MTWPVRSKRFGLLSPNAVANVFQLAGTVPVGKTWLLKEWTFYNASAGTKGVYIIVRIAGVPYVVDVALGVITGAPSGNSNHHIVLNAGDEIGFQVNPGGIVTASFHGAQLG